MKDAGRIVWTVRLLYMSMDSNQLEKKHHCWAKTPPASIHAYRSISDHITCKINEWYSQWISDIHIHISAHICSYREYTFISLFKSREYKKKFPSRRVLFKHITYMHVILTDINAIFTRFSRIFTLYWRSPQKFFFEPFKSFNCVRICEYHLYGFEHIFTYTYLLISVNIVCISEYLPVSCDPDRRRCLPIHIRTGTSQIHTDLGYEL